MKKHFAALTALVAGLTIASASQASVYNLNIFDSSSMGCPAGGCGTVTVTDTTIAGTETLDFVVNLASGVSFHASPSNHVSTNTSPVFWLSLSGSPTFTSLTTYPAGAPYSYSNVNTGSFVPSPGGNFPGPYNYDVNCTTTASGNICGSSGTHPLHFSASSSGALGINSPNGHGSFSADQIAFVADLSYTNGDVTKTGLVASSISSVPEPSTWAMMILGFFGVGFMAYRRKSQMSLRLA
jgi:hypothetical protein